MKALTVSSSPHIRSTASTQRIMLDVLIALLPASVAGCVIFGWRALFIILACTLSAVAAEMLFCLITKRRETVSDLSAAVTGLILALNLPTTAEIWQCVVGSVFAVIVVKCLFGGLGCNFANPAATGRVFLVLCFTGTIAGGAAPTIVELTSSATPLEIMSGTDIVGLPSVTDMLLGLHGGAIGEVCSLAIILGFIYLVVRRVINLETPLIFVATVFAIALIVTNDPTLALYHVLSGGLLFGAVFMATDYVTTPITRTGRMIFALGCGIITSLIRFWGTYPEGVSFAILLMNILSPYIEKLTQKRAFGGSRK